MSDWNSIAVVLYAAISHQQNRLLSDLRLIGASRRFEGVQSAPALAGAIALCHALTSRRVIAEWPTIKNDLNVAATYFRQTPDHRSLARAERGLASLDIDRGRERAARRRLIRLLSEMSSLDCPLGRADTLLDLARLEYHRDEPARALSFANDARELYETHEDTEYELRALAELDTITATLNDPSRRRTVLTRAVTVARATRDLRKIISQLRKLALFEAEENRFETARSIIAEARAEELPAASPLHAEITQTETQIERLFVLASAPDDSKLSTT